MAASTFIRGVVEGFYGRPWSLRQRRQLFDWMRVWGLNTYLYAPKDDLKHRLLWRARYSRREVSDFETVIRQCRSKGLQFIYAIAPGLDIVYSGSEDAAALRRKTSQLLALGCRRFAILFDDIQPTLSRADARAFDSLASAQAFVANRLLEFLRGKTRGAELFFCPTAYCGRMSGPPRHSDYLKQIGNLLDPSIQVFWTGPEIVSRTIPVESIRELQGALRRKPVLWDNLHANDYDQRRVYLGPYAGRPVELRAEINGILSNPNRELEANYIPLRTLAAYARPGSRWNPRRAYQAALLGWLPRWQTHGPTRISVADLQLLGDCFFLPFEFGPRAKALLEDLRVLQSRFPQGRRTLARRLDRTCSAVIGLFDRLTALKNRDLLYALYRQAWELREEAVLVRRYIDWLEDRPRTGERFAAPEYSPGPFRGGLAAELQRLLPMDERGRFGPPARSGGPRHGNGSPAF
jgi:protein O-GlcNAcase/histone acetyltransferase